MLKWNHYQMKISANTKYNSSIENLIKCRNKVNLFIFEQQDLISEEILRMKQKDY